MQLLPFIVIKSLKVSVFVLFLVLRIDKIKEYEKNNTCNINNIFC